MGFGFHINESDKELCRQVAAEFLGTLLFLVCVVSITFDWGNPPNVDDESAKQLKIAIGIGFAIATLAYAVGNISGGHLNPAVSVGMIIAGRISVTQCVLYVFGQLSGALMGTLIVYGCVPRNTTEAYQITVTELHEDVNLGQGFGLELIFTFVLVFFILSITDNRKEILPCNAALGIGVTVVACHACLIPFTGCSINPARSFGPAVVTNTWGAHWVYWVGPLCGAVLAALAYRYFFSIGVLQNEKREEGNELAECPHQHERPSL